MSNQVYLSSAQTSLSTQPKTYVDPLAQSFIVDTPGGAFAISLDLYFFSKDTSATNPAPVSIDIRTMENGFPSQVIVPFSQVIVPAENIVVSSTASQPTRFTFQAPIYLLDSTEYCFVINTNSHLYRIWTGKIGGEDVTRVGYSIPKQPYNGVMFRSQNAGTWIADQTKDIKFVMNRADFVPSGTLVLNEAAIPSVTLDSAPLETYVTPFTIDTVDYNSGDTYMTLTVDGTSITFSQEDRILISGAASSGGNNLANINGTWYISNTPNVGVSTTDFRISRDVNALSPQTAGNFPADGTYTMSTGVLYDVGSGILGSNVIRVHHKNHGFIANESLVTISGLDGDTSYNGIDGSYINGTRLVESIEQDSYTVQAGNSYGVVGWPSNMYNNIAVSPGRTGGQTVEVTENRMFDTAYLNVQNLQFKNTGTNWSMKATSGKSLAGSEVSYVLDTEWKKIATNQNTDMEHPKVVRSDNGSTKSLIVRGEMSTANSALSPVIDLNRASLIAVNNRVDNPSEADVPGYNTVQNYQSENAAVGSSALSKYITRRIDLNDPASVLKAYVLVNRPAGASIAVYYKVLPKGSDVDFNSIEWSIVNPTTAIPTTSDPNDYKEIEYDVSETDLANTQFTAFAFKVVFFSTNSSAVVGLRNFRAIALT